MNILFVGDIFGKPGRRIYLERIGDLKQRWEADLVLVNAENAAGGFGITEITAEELLTHQADVLTSGNHIWDKKEALAYITRQPRLLRPHNYPATVPGRGWTVVRARNGELVGVMNLMGRVFMEPLNCPFQAADRLLEEKPVEVQTVILDMHGEATSEKIAMGWYLAGKVSAVVGTHTHVPTADERILEGYTGFISDVGMTGTYDSVIGIKKESALKRMVHKLPERFEAATGPASLCAVLLQIDEQTGACQRIRRIQVSEE